MRERGRVEGGSWVRRRAVVGRGLVWVVGSGGRIGWGGEGLEGEGGGRTFVRVVGGHEDGSVDFQTPAAALDGA